MTIQEAFDILKAELKADSSFAWTWHCNIAMASVDEGMEHMAANRAAARFMKLCFDIDTSKSTQWFAMATRTRKVSAPTASEGGTGCDGSEMDRAVTEG